MNFLSVRGGAIVQPTNWMSYYASYSTSFNPSLEQLVSTTGTSQPLPPENNEAFEVGAKLDFFSGNLSWTGALFQITKYNARSQNPDGTFSATGTVRVQGAAPASPAHLTDQWQVFGGFTYLNARIINGVAAATQEDDPDQHADLFGCPVVDLCHHAGNRARRWRQYMGRRYANNTNTVQAPEFFRFDAMAAYHFPTFDVRLNVFNLTDVKYYDAADGVGRRPCRARQRSYRHADPDQAFLEQGLKKEICWSAFRMCSMPTNSSRARASRSRRRRVGGRTCHGRLPGRAGKAQPADRRARRRRAGLPATFAALESHPTFISAALPNIIYPPMFNRYSEGMKFGLHVDGGVRIHPHDGRKLRTDISATLFLSDPTATTAASCGIEDSTDAASSWRPATWCSIRPPACTKSRRSRAASALACFFWVQSLVRDDAKRAMLFEMDTAIQRLNETDADETARRTLDRRLSQPAAAVERDLMASAGRIKFVQWVRKTHGWFGLWGAILGLMAGFSGFWLNHRAVLKIGLPDQQQINAQLTLPDPAPTTTATMAAWLGETLKIAGPAKAVARREGTPATLDGRRSLMQPERWFFVFGGPNR